MRSVMLKRYICATIACSLVCEGVATNTNDSVVGLATNSDHRDVQTFMHVPYPNTSKLSLYKLDQKGLIKVTRMRLASDAATEMQLLCSNTTVASINYYRIRLQSFKHYMNPGIRYIEDLQNDFSRHIDWLKRFCLEKSPDISRDYLIANSTPLNEEDAYTVRKYLLDEGASLIACYDDAIELQRTIQALQLINEELDRTRLIELINGGWKTDDRILKILNGKQ